MWKISPIHHAPAKTLANELQGLLSSSLAIKLATDVPVSHGVLLCRLTF